MKKLLAVLFAVLVSTPAMANVGPRQACRDMGVQVDGIAVDQSPSFSYNGDNAGNWGLAVILIQLTDADQSISAFNLTCTGSDDGNTTNYKLQSIEVATGIGTSTDYSVTKDPNGTSNWGWRFDIEGYPDIKCTVTDTGAAATIDVVTIKLRMCTKGS